MKYHYILVIAFAAAACSKNKSSDNTVDSTKVTADTFKLRQGKIEPVGPKPSWAPDIHAEMQAVIEKLESYNARPIETLSPSEARKNPTPTNAVMDLIKEKNVEIAAPQVDTVGKTIPVSQGSIHARVYTPRTGKDKYPLILYIHGGGWVIATIDTYDGSAAGIAEQLEAVVVSIEYRKGPEHKFPTAHNDSFAAYQWLLSNSTELKGDTSHVGVVGESAGGNLAINVSMMARDKKLRMPDAEVLVYPIAQSSMETESYNRNAQAKPLNKAMMEWFVKYALPSKASAKDPKVDLTKANLKLLPPTAIITAQYDPLLSDGEILRDKLKEAGVDVTYEMYEGVTHEFFGMAAIVPEAKDAQKMAVKHLKKYLK